MKKIFFIMGMLSLQTIHAQEPMVPGSLKLKKFNATVETMQGKKFNGQITALDASGFSIQNGTGNNNGKNKAGTAAGRYYDPAEVKSLTLKRKNSVLRGALFGLGIGVVTGAIIGIASGDDPVQSYYTSAQDPYGLGNWTVAFSNAFALTAEEKAAGGAMVLGGLGAITGAIIGAVAKKKFIIRGKKENYLDLQDALMKKLVVK